MYSPVLSESVLRDLASPAGLALLQQAAALSADPFAAEKLRRSAPPELAAAAVEQVRLRERARARFTRAGQMWLTRPLLEQASGEVIARHRARRYSRCEEVVDLCSGLGGDAVALAEYCRVQAVDRDPLALALTRANAEVYGVGDRITTLQAELPAGAPAGEAGWIDPGRREGGRRTRRLDEISPTLEEVLSLRDRIPNLGVKLSPATDHAELDALLGDLPHEREFLSVRGEVRELVVWLGELRSGVRRASLVAEGVELEGSPEPLPQSHPPGRFLLEPDGAVLRAGLVGNLAESLGAWPVDPRLAFLSADHVCPTPFADIYRIETAEPFSAKALARRLREREAGDVVLKTRGFAGDPQTLRRSLRPVLKHGKPGQAPVVFITRFGDRPVMLLGERFGAGRDETR